MTDSEKMIELMNDTPAAGLNYLEWLRMGMAAKSSGLDCSDWVAWSKADARFKNENDCEKRWRGFNNTVTVATAVYIAKQHGFVVPHEWKVEGAKFKSVPFIKKDCAEEQAARIRAIASALPRAEVLVTEEDFKTMLKAEGIDRKEMAVAQLNAMFNDFDVVGLCASFDRDPEDDPDYWFPERAFARVGTIKEWIARGYDDTDFSYYNSPRTLYNHKNIPQNVLINPLEPHDGQYAGSAAEIAAYRYILVESDDVPVYDQYKTLIALNLPVACITFSGNKSIHAIVKVDAKNAKEYGERFKFVRDVCAAYGTPIDEACMNPNRWARFAGARRGRTTQSLVCTNCGAPDWESWYSDISAKIERAKLADALSHFGIKERTVADIMANPPEPVPHIIVNALKKGREGILVASSKAGKSWLMLKLAVACANGSEWLGYKCNTCRVGVVNMELGEDDIFERLQLIGDAEPLQHPENVFFLNCAGVCSDLKTLQDAIELFAKVNKLDLLIIDPIYSLMGDLEENSNGDVMQFLERLAQIRRNTGCASFMTHHTPKGSQDGKASIDMGSGAGAFARHPDCILTMMTATDDNLKGTSPEQLQYETQAGISYFVFNETLRSFKSTRREEVWRADFPNYERVYGMTYDRMSAAHTARSDASVFKYRKAVQNCLANGDKLTKTNIAARAGVSTAAVSDWAKNNPDDWIAITENAHL